MARTRRMKAKGEEAYYHVGGGQLKGVGPLFAFCSFQPWWPPVRAIGAWRSPPTTC